MFTTACTYDRAGLGWSDVRNTSDYSPAKMVSELEMLLNNSGVSEPYILVGHSLGGYNAQLYAQRNPDKVAGLILVDSMKDDQSERIPAEFKKYQLSPLTSMQAQGAYMLSQYGVLRIIGPYMPESMLPPLSKYLEGRDDYNEYLTIYALSKNLKTMYEEYSAVSTLIYTDSSNELTQISTLNDIPLIVIAAETSVDPDTPGISKETIDKTNEAFRDIQSDLSKLSSCGKLEFIEGTSHALILEKPDDISSAINEIYQKLK